MTKKNKPKNNHPDDQIADIADRLLNDDEKITADELLDDIQEMQDLMILLKQVVGKPSTENEAKERIRANLTQEWQKHGPLAKKSPWQRLRGFLKLESLTGKALNPNRRLAFNAAVVVVALLVFALFVSPSLDGETLSGTAGSETNLLPVILLGGGITAVIAIFLFKRKQ